MGEARRARAAGIEPDPKDHQAWRHAERAPEPESKTLVAGKGITFARGNAVTTIDGKKYTVRRDEAPLLSLAKLEYEQHLEAGGEKGFAEFLKRRAKEVEERANSPVERALASVAEKLPR